MSVPILIVTPNAGFGELVGQILTESGDYAISMAANLEDGKTVLQAQQIALMILEISPDEPGVGKQLKAVRQKQSGLVVIAIGAEGTADTSAIEILKPDAAMVKPVYLPDLVSKVEELVKNIELDRQPQAASSAKAVRPPDSQPASETADAPAWLGDVNLAAQYLTSLTLESAAQASLITKVDQIWAYAGELPRPAAEELARTVSGHFEDGGGSDLARFVRLEQTGGEYMLYATGLGGAFVLATVFDAEMPFSKIRSQASNLAIALASPPPQAENDLEENSDEDFDQQQQVDLWPLLEDIPPPIPNDWVPEAKLKPATDSLLDELLDDAQQDSFSSETVAIPSRSEPVLPPKKPQQKMAEVTIVSNAGETVESRPRRDPDFEDLPEPEEGFDVEPVSPSMYNLTYACVLIPRFPEHHLTGDIAQRLTDWITHLCVAFGWRLEQLSIRPDYIQWLVNVPPNTSPGYLMRTIREHTSRRMFVEFPVMEQDNPSGDFWAPGYLILGNPQPPPAALIQEFMQNTRNRQGLQEERPS